jgi:hypothetical protein
MRRRVALAATAVIGVVLGHAGVAFASPYGNAPAAVAAQAARSTTVPVIQGCILAAAQLHHLPPTVLIVLLNVEGGSIGRVSQNTNDSVDVGPMQVNEIWLPKLARHWKASVGDAFLALRDNFCANVEGGAWILSLALAEAHGEFWEGVAIYHSHDPGYQRTYLRRVLHEVLRLAPAASAERGHPTQIARNDRQ